MTRLVLAFIRRDWLLFSSYRFAFVWHLAAVVVLGYWQHANVLTALLVFIPACLTFALLGVLSAAFVLMLKQGDPILAGYSIASGFFGTTLFPSQVLPAWIRPLAALFPLTY